MSASTDSFSIRPLGRGPAKTVLSEGDLQSHSHHVLIWFTRGQGRITVAGLTRGYSANNAVFIPTGTMYRYEMAGPVIGLAVFFPTSADLMLPEVHRHYRIIDLQKQRELSNMIDAMDQELKGSDAASQRAAAYHAGLLSVWLERRNGDFEVNSPTEDAAMRLVAAYTSNIEAELSVARSVADRAAALGVTPTHLTRSCRKTCGETALSLLNGRVINEARRLLRDTSLPVKDIGAQLGFTSPAYFTRSFQAHTGQSPRAFRKNL
jgi:AraC-like DNA-binding protein/mannose-6-phosphate isomerase-like protein (cupin superfamily)